MSFVASALVIGADVQMSDDVFDRIDRIVALGVTLNPTDRGWMNPFPAPAALRR